MCKLYRNRSYKITPVYTGDVSGACSALYELGGMVVIHDPSGCNSTYNTHDEIRWYDQESLIFISGLNHVDAVMGNDEKFIYDVLRAAETLRPKFIALTSSPVPFINGTDFQALAKLIEKRSGIPAFFVETNGMHDYTVGAGNALKAATEKFLDKRVLTDKDETDKDENMSCKRIINLLGVTPLDFEAEGCVGSLKHLLKEHGWDKICCFAMESSLEELQQAKEAEVSLVVSSVGLSCAEYLEKTYGIPYVTGVPVKGLEDLVLNLIEETVLDKRSKLAWKYVAQPAHESQTCTLIGEPVRMESLAAGIRSCHGYRTEVLCPLEQPARLLMPEDYLVHGEEEAEQILMKADVILADPLYKPICNPKAQFIRIPHLAFSGRCFLNEAKDLMEVAVYEQFK